MNGGIHHNCPSIAQIALHTIEIVAICSTYIMEYSCLVAIPACLFAALCHLLVARIFTTTCQNEVACMYKQTKRTHAHLTSENVYTSKQTCIQKDSSHAVFTYYAGGMAGQSEIIAGSPTSAPTCIHIM